MAQYVPEIEIGVFGLLKSKKETQPGFKELIYIPQPHFVNGCSLESSMGAEKREQERASGVGEGKRERKRGNFKQAPYPVQSLTWGSIL